MKFGNCSASLASGKGLNGGARYLRLFACSMALLIAIAFFAVGMQAQTTGLGTISGRVVDPTGAVIVGAQITLTNTATGVTVQQTSNGDGLYRAGDLVPGPYKITVISTGFKEMLRRGVTVVSDASETVDISLTVGQKDQEVTVFADASLLNLSSGSDGQVVSMQQVEDTPTAGSNSLLLLKFSAAIQTQDASNLYMNGSYNAGSVTSRLGSFGQLSKNEYMLDGAPDQNSNHSVNYTPPPDEINEMFTDVTGFNAEVGKTLGVYTNVTSKTGTQDFHGGARWMYEDQKWQALTHFARVTYQAACGPTGTAATCATAKVNDLQPATHENNLGFSIGGPVIIPHLFDGRKRNLFFFFGSVYDPFTAVAFATATVPTLQERGLNGAPADYSDLPGCPSNCGNYTIYDPLTVAPVSGQTFYQRTAFAGNVIPNNRLVNPMLKLFNAELPLPTTATGSGVNYSYNQLQPQDFTAFTPRIDYAVTDNDHLFVRASKTHYNQTTNGITVDNIDATSIPNDAMIFSAGWTHVFTPNLVFDNTLGYSRYWGESQTPGFLKYPATSLGLPAYLQQMATANGFNGAPIVAFGNSLSSNSSTSAGTGDYSTIGHNSYPANYDKIANYRGGLTFTHGTHAFIGGGEFREQVAIGTPQADIDGVYDFDNTFTRQFSNTSGYKTCPSGMTCNGSPQVSGLSYAAYEMGLQTATTIASQVLYKRTSPYFAFWAGDTWRVSSKLTVIGGLRFEYEYGPAESHNRQMTYFNPSLVLPTANDINTAYTAKYATYAAAIPSSLPAPPTTLNIQGGSAYANVNGVSPRAWPNNWRVLPRFAAAYALRPSLVIRGGYGLFYDTTNALNESPDLTGFSATTLDSSTSDTGVGLKGDWLGADPYSGGVPAANPFPTLTTGGNFVQPLGSSLGGMAIAGNSWSFYPSNYVPARQERWNVGVEKQLDASTVLHVDYYGSWTSRIQVSQNLNSVPAAYFTGGNVVNPNSGALTTTVKANPFSNAGMSDLAASNPTVYNNVLAQRSLFTSSNVTVAQLLVPYPQLTGLTEYAPVGSSEFNELAVSLRRRMSRGFSLAVNYQQNWQTDWDYFANSFDTKPSSELSNNSRPYRLAAIGTWELPFGKNRQFANHGLLSKAFGGFQLSNAYEKQEGALIGFGNLIYTGGDPKSIKLSHPSYGEWFNTQNFGTGTQLGSYNLRVFPTRIAGVRQQGYGNLNSNLERNIPLTERANMRLRFECFDIFNHTEVGAPNTTPTSSQFGQVTANNGNFARFMQAQARITF